MGKILHPVVADHPDVVALVEALGPDPVRDALATAYRDAYHRLSAAQTRAREIRTRIEEFTLVAIDATGKDRERNFAERGALNAESSSLPEHLAILARRSAQAHLDWAAYLHREATDYHNRAFDESGPLTQERRQQVTLLQNLEESTGRVEKNQEAYAARRTRLAQLDAELAPFRAKQELAKRAIEAIDTGIRRRFEHDGRPGVHVSTQSVEDFVRGTVRAAA